jgi:UDP-glucose 4-epimerase
VRESGAIAILGGMGYLGQALQSRLAQKNRTYWAIGRQNAKDISGGENRYRCFEPSLPQALQAASTVFHLASVTTPALGEKKPSLDVDNIALTLSLTEACEKAGVHHLVFASSGGTVYGELTQPATEESPARPICSYGIAKLACEQYLAHFARRSKVHVTVLRMSNVYGGNQIKKGEQGVIGYLRNQIVAGQSIRLFGDTVRDYIYIDDTINAFERVLEHSVSFRVLNISTGIGTRLSDLAKLASRLMKKETSIMIDERRPFDLDYNVLNNTFAQQVLKWRPAFSLEQGLDRYLNPPS